MTGSQQPFETCELESDLSEGADHPLARYCLFLSMYPPRTLGLKRLQREINQTKTAHHQLHAHAQGVLAGGEQEAEGEE